jgi:hypothetical protein
MTSMPFESKIMRLMTKATLSTIVMVTGIAIPSFAIERVRVDEIDKGRTREAKG